jgi:hypothetical protein
MLKGNSEDRDEEGLQEAGSPQSVPATRGSALSNLAYDQPWRQKVKVRTPARQELPAVKRPDLPVAADP